MYLHCPVCKSTDIFMKYYIPVSKYGHLPRPKVDYCNCCGFSSGESFKEINFRQERDYKINKVIENNGI